MKVTATGDYVVYIEGVRNVVTTGQVFEVGKDLASRLFAQNAATPAATERAVKPKAERAVKR